MRQKNGGSSSGGRWCQLSVARQILGSASHPGAAMTSTTETTEQPVEHADLARFGYNQELHRRVGSFASFAAGFSYVSILTTVFQLFFLGYGFGGAAVFL